MLRLTTKMDFDYYLENWYQGYLDKQIFYLILIVKGIVQGTKETCEGTRGSWVLNFGHNQGYEGIFHCLKGHFSLWSKFSELQKLNHVKIMLRFMGQRDELCKTKSKTKAIKHRYGFWPEFQTHLRPLLVNQVTLGALVDVERWHSREFEICF